MARPTADLTIADEGAGRRAIVPKFGMAKRGPAKAASEDMVQTTPGIDSFGV